MWTYRLLLILNAPALLFSLYLAISVLPDLGSRFTTIKAILVVWPLLQLLGLWMAVKAKGVGEVVRASLMLFVQFLVFTVLTIVILTLGAIAMFPE